MHIEVLCEMVKVVERVSMATHAVNILNSAELYR